MVLASQRQDRNWAGSLDYCQFKETAQQEKSSF
jgi:hypothetical protein